MTISLPDFSKTKILVIGDVMLDQYWHGDTTRISPEAPVPVVKVNNSAIQHRPGGAANVALNVACLGCDTHLMAITGQDDAADQLKQLLNNHQTKTPAVHCHFIQSQKQPTITKLRVVSRSQQLIRLDFEETFSKTYIDQLSKCSHDFLLSHHQHLNVIIISDYKKSTLSQVKELIVQANEYSIPVLIDPKGNDYSLYKNADLLTPNLSEFETIVGECHNEQDIVEKGHNLIKALNLKALLVTRGKDGMSLLRVNQPPFHLRTKAREVFDVTGAGDTVIAVVAAMLGSKVSIEAAVEAANRAASLVVSRLGTAAITPKELSDTYQTAS